MKTHRREITVVFTDLRGFTAFTETAEPEEVMGVLRDYHADARRIVDDARRHDRALRRRRRDDPLQRPDASSTSPSSRRCAWRSRCATRSDKLSAGWKKRGHELGFGVGIANGYATMGAIGFEGRRDYGAIGPVCNLSARLCSEAKAGPDPGFAARVQRRSSRARRRGAGGRGRRSRGSTAPVPGVQRHRVTRVTRSGCEPPAASREPRATATSYERRAAGCESIPASAVWLTPVVALRSTL